ncbi:unnamed protein product [Ectocarpus sp. 6 AP-2014]
MASTDRDVLVALYNATEGANWENSTNWGTDADLSQWFGAKVNDQGRVVLLDLPVNNLRGHIPPQLGDLGALGYFDISSNNLDGELVQQIEHHFFFLRVLLAGPIPPELGKLGALKRLDLSNNKLDGAIPPELGNLGALTTLDLGANNLSGPIPSELEHLSALKELDLTNNELSGPIPPELGNLEGLEILSLRNNHLTGLIPKELGALSTLKKLLLAGNRLTGTIPPTLGKLTALQTLSLSGNELSGNIPKELGALNKLKSLDIGSNQLSRLWHALGRDETGSMAAGPGTLPVPLACLLDSLERIDRLSVAQNPWESPPDAIVVGGIPAVRAYFEAIYMGGTTAVTRPLKVVIVGKETVGKTSLRRSIKTGKPCMTRGGGEESTVHVDVEDHDLDGHPIRMFDCAGQVVYYGLLQLFLTPRAVYLLVWDAAKASEMEGLNLEDLAIAPWLRHLTFRVPDASVILVGNKCDRVVRTRRTAVAVDVEHESRQWLESWIEISRGHQPRGISLEDGVSLVSCAASGVGAMAPSFGRRSGWPCDKSTPGLFHRIIYDSADDTRVVTMRLPESYRLALEMLEELASCSRSKTEQQTRGITRAILEEKWQAKVAEMNRAGTSVAAPDAAMAGAILIRKWEGGLVEYGSYVFLDVEWFATVLDPLFCHKRDSYGKIDLGGITVMDVDSLDRLDEEHVLEPQLAEDLWGPVLAPHLLLALKSAGLTFPLSNDSNGGLVILLRMDTKPPPDYGIKLKEKDQANKFDLKLVVECSFSLGLPPGFVERLLARCCHLGLPYPFWRYGALIVGKGAEERMFSLSLEYSEARKILTVEVSGGHTEVFAWAALSKVLSVTIKMLSEFPGLPCGTTFFCPLHKTNGMKIRTKDARPGSSLVGESDFCKLCQDRSAAVGLVAVALQVVEFSDEKFFDEQLREQFAGKVALQGCASWPGSNSEVSGPAPVHISPSGQAPAQTSSSSQACTTLSKHEGTSSGSRPWYQDVKTFVGAASLACIAVFGVFHDEEDDDPRLWGVFLGLGMLLVGVEFGLIAREYKLLCFTPRAEAASAGNERRGETRV